MQNYRKTSHTTYDCKYHIVWITKYRKKVMSGVIAERIRELLRQICKEKDVEIIKGHVSKDHIHLFVSVPPHLAVSKSVQSLKGKSSYKLLGENKELSKQFWGRHLWARGYFVATSGNVTDEVIMEYIKNQEIKEGDDDFTISDPL
ncbi:MAG: IS200/IS605 family transposase [Saprospiraceae bacterium]|nr:IS200/IS605 family transposase [Saprospiraceae bacterium]